MFQLKPDEKIILSIHKHWIVLAGKIITTIILIALPFIGLFFLFQLNQGLILLILFLISIYLLFIFSAIFLFWIDFYLDMWIITDKRIVDIEQYGLFNREVSEFMLNKIQDITIEIPGLLANILKYGNIIIQTAGEKSFTIKDVPNTDKIKDCIMHYSYINHKT